MGKSASNTLIQAESSVTEISEALTDSGDHQIFTGTAEIFSGDGDLSPQIIPDGVVSGSLTPHTDNDKLNYSFVVKIGGEEKTISGTVTITRASTGTHAVNGIHYDGSSVTAVKGTEHTAFATGRGVAGSPPYIAVGSIELGQVKTSSQTAAAILPDEIFQSANNGTQERFDYPNWYTPVNLGLGNETDAPAQKYAHLKFQKALATSHTGDTCKGVYVVVNEPDFADIEASVDWLPAELTPSISSKQIHRITTGTPSVTLSGGATFKMFWDKPTAHWLRKKEGRTLTFRVYPDFNFPDEYELTQGIVGFKSFNPVNDDMGADVTIASVTKSVRFD